MTPTQSSYLPGAVQAPGDALQAAPADHAEWIDVPSSQPTHDQEVSALRNWIDKRLAWLDGQAAVIPAIAPEARSRAVWGFKP